MYFMVHMHINTTLYINCQILSYLIWLLDWFFVSDHVFRLEGVIMGRGERELLEIRHYREDFLA